MADIPASLLALLNIKSEELGPNPSSALLFAFALRLRPREGKVGCLWEGEVGRFTLQY